MSHKRIPPKKGGSRLGKPNKVGAGLKTDLMTAYEEVGGVDYLKMVALTDHKTFCALLGKVLPMQVVGDGSNALTIQVVTGIDRTPNDPVLDAKPVGKSLCLD